MQNLPPACKANLLRNEGKIGRTETEIALHVLADFEHDFFFPRHSDELNSDWQTFLRLCNWNNGSWHSEHVEELRVRKDIEVFNCLAFDLPVALSMFERRNGTHRT